MRSTPSTPDAVGILEHHGDLLKDYLRPRACLECIVIAYETFATDASVAHSALLSCHAFWDASIRVITALRTEVDIEILHQQLVKNVDVCRYTHIHHDLSAPPPTANLAHLLISVLYAFICDGLVHSTEHGKLHGKNLKKWLMNGRLWPIRPNDFAPFGQRQSAEAHVRWCIELIHASPMRAFSGMLIRYRPILFPSLLDDDLRERLVWCLVQMLNSEAGVDTFAWSERISGQPTPRRNRNWLAATTSHMSVRIASLFLEVVMGGPDSKPDNNVRFSLGYERALLPAINTSLDLTEEARLDEAAMMTLTRWAYYLYARLPVPDTLDDSDSQPLSQPPALHPSAQLRLLASEQLISQSPRGIWRFETLQTGLQKMYMERTCYGPSCGKGIHETHASKPFPLCARCKFTQYCSKACQIADWKHATQPHKEFCHVLRCVHPALNGTVEHFKAALHSSHAGGPSTYDPDTSKRFVDWVMARGLITNRLLAK